MGMHAKPKTAKIADAQKIAIFIFLYENFKFSKIRFMVSFCATTFIFLFFDHTNILWFEELTKSYVKPNWL